MKENDSKILIIDDQPANLKVLLYFLEQHDFKVRIAENGKRALQVLDNFHADIILLDVVMPEMNGFETCCKIKDNKETADIPVIFMTALDALDNKVTGFDAGGVDYITKPFQQAEVLARLNTHLTLRRQRLDLEEALEQVKQLSGLLSICSFCKNIHTDKGQWQRMEEYISEHSEARFSHALCPECVQEHYGYLYNKKDEDEEKKNGEGQ